MQPHQDQGTLSCYNILTHFSLAGGKSGSCFHLESPAGDAGKELKGLLSPSVCPSSLLLLPLTFLNSLLVTKAENPNPHRWLWGICRSTLSSTDFSRLFGQSLFLLPTIASSPNEFSKIFSKEQIVKLLPLGKLSFKQQWAFYKIFNSTMFLLLQASVHGGLGWHMLLWTGWAGWAGTQLAGLHFSIVSSIKELKCSTLLLLNHLLIPISTVQTLPWHKYKSKFYFNFLISFFFTFHLHTFNISAADNEGQKINWKNQHNLELMCKHMLTESNLKMPLRIFKTK